MKTRTFFTLIVLVILTPVIAYSKIITFEGQEYDFNKPEWEIAKYEEKRATKEMGAIYNMIMDAYGENKKNEWKNPWEFTAAINQLKVSQQAWIKYHDAEAWCEVRLLYFGGSQQGTAYNQRSTELTKQRIERLKKLLENVHEYLEEEAYKYKEEDYHLNKRMQQARQNLEKIKKMEAEEPPSIIKELKEQLRIDNESNKAGLLR